MDTEKRLSDAREDLLSALLQACRQIYDERLVTVAIFGSYGRGTMRPDSDLDCLIVVEGLADGRMARVREFSAVDKAMAGAIVAARRAGVHTQLSPHFKTPFEATKGSVLFLDMTEDAKLLYDRDGFFAGVLRRMQDRLDALGSRRIWRGTRWYWDLKPDYRPGMIFEL